MSEMLANSYFISRNFAKALPLFEQELRSGHASDKIKKKAIICYLALGRVEEAFRLFYELVSRDPYIIINTDPYWDDCPCPEMVQDFEGKKQTALESTRTFLAMGMLYLFCDVSKSVHYFEQAVQLNARDLKLNSLLQRLQSIRQSV